MQCHLCLQGAGRPDIKAQAVYVGLYKVFVFVRFDQGYYKDSIYREGLFSMATYC